MLRRGNLRTGRLCAAALACLVGFAAPLPAQEPDPLSAELVPKGPYAVGDRFELRARFRAPADAAPTAVLPDDAPDAHYGDPVFTQIRRGEWRVSVPIQIFRVGPYPIPPIRILAGSNALETAPLSAQTLSVRSGADADLLKEPKPPLPLRRPLLIFIGWALPAALSAGLLLYAIRRRSAAKRQPAPTAAISPEAWLERELARLDARLAQGGEPAGRIAAEAADLARGYLSRKNLAPALRLSSAATLSAMRPLLPDAVQEQLSALLRSADNVKFAAILPEQDAERRRVNDARNLCADIRRNDLQTG